MTSQKIKVAFGIFMWSSAERQTDRYGVVLTVAKNYDEDAQVDRTQDDDLLKTFIGSKVRLTCKVIETRKSGHCGDVFRKIYPSQPEVGEEVDLGVGTLDLVPEWDGSMGIMLRPGDGRSNVWMDPRKLLRLHDQTVEIFVQQTDEDFTPAPDLPLPEKGCIDNGDGSLQVKMMPSTFTLTPSIDRLGEGLFSIGMLPPQKGRRMKTSEDPPEEPKRYVTYKDED